MVCPVCPVAGAVGGSIGGYIGIEPPQSKTLRIVSAAITTSLVVITIVALKCLCGISICDGNGDFSLRNICQVVSISALLAIIYSLAVNSILNFFFPYESQPIAAEEPAPCCCSSNPLNEGCVA